jgi:hypothetical protein
MIQRLPNEVVGYASGLRFAQPLANPPYEI